VCRVNNYKDNNNNNNNNNNNSHFIYLRANLTAQNPVTKLAQVRRKKEQQNCYKQNKK
jgi:hypothetical protein